MPDSRLTKQVFLADFNRNINNWCSEIEQIFDSVNCLVIFQERITCDLLSFESKLKFNLQNEWHNEINKKPKLRTYVRNIFPVFLFTQLFFSFTQLFFVCLRSFFSPDLLFN